jgi:PmbA protein
MEQILKLAGKVSDKAEVYSLEYRTDGVSFENARFKDIDSRIQSGISLRIIKDGKQGFAYTKNPVRKEDLIRNALDSLKGGVEGPFDFPLTKDLPALNTYDPAIETISNTGMVEECERVCRILSGKITGQINVSAHRAASSIRIINSSGSDLSWKTSSYVFNPELIYPYSASALQRALLSKSFEKAGDDYLNFLADMYSKSMREVNVEGGRMKVLFLPETMYVLLWRLQAAANGQSIYQNISPLADKINAKIFDGRLSVINDPLNDDFPGARACDDEGVRCRKYPIIENGVLKNFYYDLYFAQKLNALPSGNGFRAGESSKPVPGLRHVSILRGDKSFSQLIQSMDQGIIIAGALGAHSGNIPNGDFSIGLSPALYVENGEITGHVKDAMAAGNVYDTFNRIAGIEDTAHFSLGGRYPSMLFDDVSITSKKGD